MAKSQTGIQWGSISGDITVIVLDIIVIVFHLHLSNVRFNLTAKIAMSEGDSARCKFFLKKVYGTDFIFGPRMLIENVVIFSDPNPTTKIFPSMRWQKCHRGFLLKIVFKNKCHEVFSRNGSHERYLWSTAVKRLVWNNCTLQYKIDFNRFLSF